MLADSGSVTLSGFRELDETFTDLGKTLGKGVLRRVGIKALEPMAERARAAVAVRKGFLQRSIHVGTRLARSQKQRVRREGGSFRLDAKDDVTVHMGPGQDPAAITEEFGKFNQAPDPFMRPAFDAEAVGTIDRVGKGLWPEIEKTAARRARKLARQAGG